MVLIITIRRNSRWTDWLLTASLYFVFESGISLDATNINHRDGIIIIIIIICICPQCIIRVVLLLVYSQCDWKTKNMPLKSDINAVRTCADLDSIAVCAFLVFSLHNFVYLKFKL